MLPQLNQYLFIHHFYLLDFVLRSSSSQAEDINKLHFYFLYAAAFILLVVTVFTIYVLKKFQNKVGEEYHPKTLNSKWEILMIGIPLAMVTVFFFLSLQTMNRVLPSTENKTPFIRLAYNICAGRYVSSFFINE
ncbi:MAG: cytochrome c oxidase subunit II transmembrane domain-containing protein [Chitinophagaceae bacterium]